MTLTARLANYRARRVHVTDMREPAVRALFWLREYRKAMDLPTDQREVEADYAEAAFNRAREQMRSDIRFNNALKGAA